MSLERALHDRWQSYRPLVRRVAPERVFTGRTFGSPPLPYVVIRRGAIRESVRTSGGYVYQRTQLSFSVYSAALEDAKQIQHEIRRRFDRRDFPFDGGVCLDLRWSDQLESLGDDGVWVLTSEYLAMNEVNAAH